MLTKKIAKYLLLVADFAAINIALAFIFWMRYKSGWFPETLDPSRHHWEYTQLALIISLCWMGYFFFRGLYRDWSLQSRAVQVALVSRDITLFSLLLLAVLAGSLALEAWKEMRFLDFFTPERLAVILSYWGVFLLFINGARLLALGLARRLLLRGVGLDRLLILG